MDFVVFWGLIILLSILAIVGFPYLAYRIPKKLGYKKLGIWLGTFLALAFLILIAAIIFEDYLFFKSDATKVLNAHQIELKNDFKLILNESSGISDYYHQFILSISSDDKKRLIRQIKDAGNFVRDEIDEFDIRSGKPRYSEKDTTFTANYHNKFYYIYEYYRPNKIGYSPTWEIISISKAENKLMYEEILD